MEVIQTVKDNCHYYANYVTADRETRNFYPCILQMFYSVKI